MKRESHNNLKGRNVNQKQTKNNYQNKDIEEIWRIELLMICSCSVLLRQLHNFH